MGGGKRGGHKILSPYQSPGTAGGARQRTAGDGPKSRGNATAAGGRRPTTPRQLEDELREQKLENQKLQDDLAKLKRQEADLRQKLEGPAPPKFEKKQEGPSKLTPEQEQIVLQELLYDGHAHQVTTGGAAQMTSSSNQDPAPAPGGGSAPPPARPAGGLEMSSAQPQSTRPPPPRSMLQKSSQAIRRASTAVNPFAFKPGSRQHPKHPHNVAGAPLAPPPDPAGSMEFEQRAAMMGRGASTTYESSRRLLQKKFFQTFFTFVFNQPRLPGWGDHDHDLEVIIDHVLFWEGAARRGRSSREQRKSSSSCGRGPRPRGGGTMSFLKKRRESCRIFSLLLACLWQWRKLPDGTARWFPSHDVGRDQLGI